MFHPVISEAQHGDVIELLGPQDKVVDAAGDVAEDALGAGAGLFVEDFDHAVGAEELVLVVGGFGDAVGVDEEAVAGVELEVVLAEGDVVHDGDGGGVAVFDQLVPAAGAAEDGVLVAGVGGHALAGGELDDGQPDGDEHFSFVALHELAVDILQGPAGGIAALEAVADENLGDHHEEGGGDALAGDVGHDQGDVVVVDQEEIIEVAADLLGGGHGGVDVEFMPVGVGREEMGQGGGLDGGGHAQLGVDPLLFRRDGLDFVQVLDSLGRQGGEALGQDLDLVVGLVFVLHKELEVAAAETGDPCGDGIEGIDDLFGQVEGGGDGEDADEGQEGQEGLPAPVQGFREGGPCPTQDLLVILLHENGGLVGQVLVHAGGDGPAQGLHGGAAHVVGRPVRLHLMDACLAVHGFGHEGGQALVDGLAQVGGLGAQADLEGSPLLRREDHMAVLVDDTGKAAGLRRVGYFLLEGIQKEVGAGHGGQFSPDEDGDGADDLDPAGKDVPLHVGEVDPVPFGGAGKPVPLGDGDIDQFSVLVIFSGGVGVRDQHDALGEGDEGGIHAGVLAHGGHHAGHVGDEADLPRDGRFLDIHPLRSDQLDGHPAVQVGIRAEGLRGGDAVRVCEEGPGILRRHHDIAPELLKEVVGKLRPHLRPADQAVLDHAVHGRVGEPGDGLLLVGIGLLDERAQGLVLPEEDGCVDCHDQDDRKQDQVEDFILYASDDQVFDFFHSDVLLF